MKKVVIASVLKPVDDPRMFEKIGRSLSHSGKYKVIIIGYHSKDIPHSDSIQCIPLFSFKRTSLARLMAPWKILKYIFKIKPDLFIITTHELLIIAGVYRLFNSCRIVYDVQENYMRNIIKGRSYPPFLKYCMGLYIRIKENILSGQADHFFLAEKIYKDQLTFINDRYTILLNKFSRNSIQKMSNGNNITLLYSGTIARENGIFEAVTLSERLHQLNPLIRLQITGYCPVSKTLQELIGRTSNKSYIELNVDMSPVSHQKILKAIASADFGLVCYQKLDHLLECMPTKIYEYIALELPLLLTDHKPWVDFCKKFEACIPFDFTKYDPVELLNKMQTTIFFQSGIDATEVMWDTEEKKLRETMSQISG